VSYLPCVDVEPSADVELHGGGGQQRLQAHAIHRAVTHQLHNTGQTRGEKDNEKGGCEPRLAMGDTQGKRYREEKR
jgi:hypothetical protein